MQTPIVVWAIAPATSVSVDGAMLSLRAPNGQNWSSGWTPVGLHLFPEAQGFNATFKVKKSFFEHVKATPVQAHISFALSTFQNGETKRIVATSGEFKVPGLGFCSIVQGYSGDSLRCRYVFRNSNNADDGVLLGDAMSLHSGWAGAFWAGFARLVWIFGVRSGHSYRDAGYLFLEMGGKYR